MTEGNNSQTEQAQIEQFREEIVTIHQDLVREIWDPTMRLRPRAEEELKEVTVVDGDIQGDHIYLSLNPNGQWHCWTKHVDDKGRKTTKTLATEPSDENLNNALELYAA